MDVSPFAYNHMQVSNLLTSMKKILNAGCCCTFCVLVQVYNYSRASLVSAIQVRCSATSGHLIRLPCRGWARRLLQEVGVRGASPRPEEVGRRGPATGRPWGRRFRLTESSHTWDCWVGWREAGGSSATSTWVSSTLLLFIIYFKCPPSDRSIILSVFG